MQSRALSLDMERYFALAALALIALIAGQVTFQSFYAWNSGEALKDIMPVFEAPIVVVGKALGDFFTFWIPATWRIPTPFGPIEVQETLAYIIYEWVKLPIILFLTTFGMTLLRLRVGTRWIQRTIGRNDLVGAWGGTVLGLVTPVCSCVVPNIYVGIVAGGASQRASAAFLFTSPAMNKFAILFMFVIVGPLGAGVYVLAGMIAAMVTAYAAPLLGLVPERFVGEFIPLDAKSRPEPGLLLVEAFRESCQLFRRLLFVVLISGALAGLLINFNLTLVASLQEAGAAWYGPLLGTAIGLPLDINAASTAPILIALRDIVPIGTLVSAMMATTVASVPHWVLLNKLVGRWNTIKVVAWFASYVVVVGLILNALFAA